MESEEPQPFQLGSRPRSSSARLVTLVVILIALYTVFSRSAGSPRGWGSDFAAASTEARGTGRRLVVAFHMQGCPPCAAMDRSVLGSRTVQNALKHFVPVRVDLMNERELSNRLGVFATPTYAVLESDGTMVTYTEGFQPVEKFVQFLERAGQIARRE